MTTQMKQDDRQLTKDIVKELTDNDHQFTAFDVTKLVRGTTGERTPHWMVKGVVHKMFDDGEMHASYTHRLTSIPGTNDQALLYYDPNSNQGGYDPDFVPNLNCTQSVQVPDSDEDDDDSTGTVAVSVLVQDATDDDDDDDDDDDTVDAETVRTLLQDSRGRLCVPVSFTKFLGASPGDTVVVYPVGQMPGHIQIYKPISSNFVSKPEDRKYVVDKHGNVRIVASVLTEAKLKMSGPIKITKEKTAVPNVGAVRLMIR